MRSGDEKLVRIEKEARKTFKVNELSVYPQNFESAAYDYKLLLNTNHFYVPAH